jgi:hypothetical protein
MRRSWVSAANVDGAILQFASTPMSLSIPMMEELTPEPQGVSARKKKKKTFTALKRYIVKSRLLPTYNY